MVVDFLMGEEESGSAFSFGGGDGGGFFGPNFGATLGAVLGLVSILLVISMTQQCRGKAVVDGGRGVGGAKGEGRFVCDCGSVLRISRIFI